MKPLYLQKNLRCMYSNGGLADKWGIDKGDRVEVK